MDGSSVANGIIVLGIDPALGTTGYGVLRCSVNSFELLDAGFVRCGRDAPLENRLQELHSGIVEILAEHKPDCFAIEQLYSHYDRPTTAILMGHAAWRHFVGRSSGRCTGWFLRCYPSQKDTDWQWPRSENSDAIRSSAPIEFTEIARTCRRCRCVSDRSVPLPQHPRPCPTSWAQC